MVLQLKLKKHLLNNDLLLHSTAELVLSISLMSGKYVFIKSGKRTLSEQIAKNACSGGDFIENPLWYGAVICCYSSLLNIRIFTEKQLPKYENICSRGYIVDIHVESTDGYPRVQHMDNSLKIQPKVT